MSLFISIAFSEGQIFEHKISSFEGSDDIKDTFSLENSIYTK